MNNLPPDGQQLHDLVEANGGVLAVDMRALSEARRVYRLGRHVRSDMQAWLTKANLGFWPDPLPNDAGHPVLLFATDSMAGTALRLAFDISRAQQRSAPDAAAA